MVDKGVFDVLIIIESSVYIIMQVADMAWLSGQ